MSSTYTTLGHLVNTHEAHKMTVTQDMDRCVYYSYSNVALSQYAKDRGSQSHHHHLMLGYKGVFRIKPQF
jgi:hypothetical protein